MKTSKKQLDEYYKGYTNEDIISKSYYLCYRRMFEEERINLLQKIKKRRLNSKERS